jgi:DnaK suppressor protein
VAVRRGRRLDKHFLYSRRGLVALAGLVRVRDRFAGLCVHPETWDGGSRVQDSGANSGEIFVRPKRDEGYTMTKTELKRFDAVLRAKATELKNAVRNREAIAIETNSDLMDQIQLATERELALDRLERESNIAREVRAALSRVQTNSFGLCLECEQEIGLKRLVAVPWTRSYIVCQEAADRNRNQPGEKLLVHAA